MSRKKVGVTDQIKKLLLLFKTKLSSEFREINQQNNVNKPSLLKSIFGLIIGINVHCRNVKINDVIVVQNAVFSAKLIKENDR